MRVLVFSTDDHLYPAGGAEQAFGNITERLPDIEFDLICAKLRPGVKGYERVKNVHIHRMGFGVPRLDGVILALFGHFCAYKLMRKHRFDLIWSVMASYGAFAVVRVKRKTGLPFLLTLQEGDPFEHIYGRVRFVRGRFNQIFKCADGIQAISRHLLQWGKEMGYRGKEGRVIPNGVALDAFRTHIDGTTLEESRRAFGFPEGSFILMTSSRLEKKNGVRDVIEALPALPEYVRFVICGSGSLEKELRDRTERLGLSHRVRFMGFVDPKDVPRMMRASDAFIRPSLSEGLGTAFLEAMAARIPVIATLVGGIPDFLTNEVTGFAVRVEDPQSVREAVEKVMRLEPNERKALLDRAERMVVEKYDWDKVAHSMREMFETLATPS